MYGTRTPEAMKTVPVQPNEREVFAFHIELWCIEVTFVQNFKRFSSQWKGMYGLNMNTDECKVNDELNLWSRLKGFEPP